MSDNKLAIVVGSIVACFAVLLFINSMNEKGIKSGSKLPTGATEVVEVGSGWYEFTYKGERFLFYHYGIGDTTRAALVKLDKHG